MTGVLEPDEFYTYLARQLGIAEDLLVDEARIYHELEFSSVEFLELVVVIEELGVEFPDEVFDELVTLGDAYTLYVRYAGSR